MFAERISRTRRERITYPFFSWLLDVLDAPLSLRLERMMGYPGLSLEQALEATESTSGLTKYEAKDPVLWN